MNIAPLKREIDQIAKDKGIDAAEIIAALEDAIHEDNAADVKASIIVEGANRGQVVEVWKREQ